MKRIVLAVLFAGLVSRPVLAEDAPFPHCGLFCKVWRNVSGRVQNPVSAPSWDDERMIAPTPEQEGRIPRPAEIVAVHGEVLRKTRAERQREQAAMADEIKHIEALRNDGAPAKATAGETFRRTVGSTD